MRVLLISPRNPKTPNKLKFLSGGENTYTEALLKNPPSGVKYTFYLDALKKGLIEYSVFQKPLNLLIKFRILPLSPQIICFRIKTNFDLIHAHGHPIKISGKHPPVLLGDSSGNFQYLIGYLKWSITRVRIGYFLKKVVYKIFDIYDQEINLKEAKLTVWSKFSKKNHLILGSESNKIIIIPPGLELPHVESQKNRSKNFYILFIGTWLKRKGGLILIKAFEKLRREYPLTRLLLIGELPKNVNLPKNTYYKSYISRKKLIEQIYPKASVLVLVPEVAEGYGLTPLEAAAFKIPSIVSHIAALPEIVDQNKTGIVIKPGSIDELAEAIEKLILDVNLKYKMGQAAFIKFKKCFWIKVTNKKLLKVYQESLNS